MLLSNPTSCFGSHRPSNRPIMRKQNRIRKRLPHTPIASHWSILRFPPHTSTTKNSVHVASAIAVVGSVLFCCWISVSSRMKSVNRVLLLDSICHRWLRLLSLFYFNGLTFFSNYRRCKILLIFNFRGSREDSIRIERTDASTRLEFGLSWFHWLNLKGLYLLHWLSVLHSFRRFRKWFSFRPLASKKVS